MLTSLGIRTSKDKIPIMGNIFFYRYKINEIINMFLLARDKFMPEIHLRQPWFTYSAWEPFPTNKEQIKKSNGRFKIYLSKWTR